MTQPDLVRLAHMLEAAEKCAALWRGRSFSDLLHDETATLATVRLLEILGEAAKNVSSDTRARHPDVPWRHIAGTRDRLIHGYFDVDLKVIWAIVVNDLPALIDRLREIARGE
ncbi:MAG: HepT-like ribonuclease domain-containing protein [Thermoleophilia bacterium]